MSKTEKSLLQQLLRQEEALQFSRFSSDTALQLGLGIVDAAKQAGQSVLVDIRFGDLQLFQVAFSRNGNNQIPWSRQDVYQEAAHADL